MRVCGRAGMGDAGVIGYPLAGVALYISNNIKYKIKFHLKVPDALNLDSYTYYVKYLIDFLC